MNQEINKNKLVTNFVSKIEFTPEIDNYEQTSIINIQELKEFINRVENEGFDKVLIDIEVDNFFGDMTLSYKWRGWSQTIESDDERDIRVQRHYDTLTQEQANQKSLAAKNEYALFKRLQHKYKNDNN